MRSTGTRTASFPRLGERAGKGLVFAVEQAAIRVGERFDRTLDQVLAVPLVDLGQTCLGLQVGDELGEIKQLRPRRRVYAWGRSIRRDLRVCRVSQSGRDAGGLGLFVGSRRDVVSARASSFADSVLV